MPARSPFPLSARSPRACGVRSGARNVQFFGPRHGVISFLLKSQIYAECSSRGALSQMYAACSGRGALS